MKYLFLIAFLIPLVVFGQEEGDSIATKDNNESTIAYKDEIPYYIDGSFDKYIEKNFIQPKQYKRGKLCVMFTVEKNGTLSDIRIVPGKTFPPEQTAEAIRVITSSSGRWMPGKINGKSVRCIVRQCFSFEK